MKKTLIVMSSNREPEKQTRESLQQLRQAGANMLEERGSSCVAFARNRALSLACEHLRAGTFGERDTVLMLDDDMEISVQVAQALVDASRKTGVATSGAYATITSRLAGTRWKERPGRWQVGLGCLAVPQLLLLELEAASDSFEMNAKAYTQFTWVGAENGVWVGEDYRLSMQLGGVHLLPLRVGHIKKVALEPDDETLRRIAAAEELSP